LGQDWEQQQQEALSLEQAFVFSFWTSPQAIPADRATTANNAVNHFRMPASFERGTDSPTPPHAR
jgi:hypothetical protein